MDKHSESGLTIRAGSLAAGEEGGVSVRIDATDGVDDGLDDALGVSRDASDDPMLARATCWGLSAASRPIGRGATFSRSATDRLLSRASLRSCSLDKPWACNARKVRWHVSSEAVGELCRREKTNLELSDPLCRERRQIVHADVKI
jgi:hypothetical protein